MDIIFLVFFFPPCLVIFYICQISWILSFWVLDIFVCLQEHLSFTLECSYLAIVRSFLILLLRFVRQNWSKSSLGLFIPTTEARLFCVLFLVLHEFWSFPTWLVRTDTIPSPVWVPDAVTSNLFECFFLLTQIVLHRHALLKPQLRQTVSRSLEFPCCAALLSLVQYDHWSPCWL